MQDDSPPSQPIPLGPYVLECPVARGGVGVVWRGRHVAERLPVAVKVLPGVAAEQTAARRAFRREVRAVSGLNHPGVVAVHDYGEIPPQTAARDPRLPALAPYLVMDYASRGSLKSVRRLLPWSDLRRLLLAILDALAHAHARGVIHRDIKAGNILLFGSDDPRPGAKLTDFGIAHALDSGTSFALDSGTPSTMAPEQFTRSWVDFGPWTDLYALGCLAWKLTTGSNPYRGRAPLELARQHLTAPLPPFKPAIYVPPGLDDWLRTLLAKSITHRFQRAADAASALSALESRSRERRHRPQIPVVRHVTLETTLVVPELEPLSEVEEGPASTPQIGFPRPAMPTSWRRLVDVAPALPLRGAGLGLFALRSIPFVGRDRERDLLWSELREVISENAARAICLVGAAGVGKSRLVEWFTQRAHETGSATVLRAVHNPLPTAADGIGSMLARHLGTQRLKRPQVEARVRLWLQRWKLVEHIHPLAVSELLHPAPADHTGDVIRLATVERQHEVAEHLLGALAAQRPLVVWLDDVQWGTESIQLVQHALRRHLQRPILFLLTIQSEALAEKAAARRLVQALESDSGCTHHLLQPLQASHHRALIQTLLGFEGDLAERLASRTQGNPLFTIQVVGDWVSRGLLQPTRQGFTLRTDAEVQLPDTLHGTWSAHIERLLEGHSPAERDALELAAALGQEVVDEEWIATAAALGIESDLLSQLLERLRASSLAVNVVDGWAFAHGMLRESLQRIAAERGTWRRLNHTCAMVLDAGASSHERVGRHLYEAGAWAEAAHRLFLAAERAIFSGGVAARSLLALHEDAHARAQLPDDDPSWARLAILTANSLISLTRFEDARVAIARARDLARQHGWKDEGAQVLRVEAEIARRQGYLHQARVHYEQALAQFTELEDDKHVMLCSVGLGHTYLLSGRVAEALPLFECARAMSTERGDLARIGVCIRFLGDAARLQQKSELAQRYFEEAAEVLYAAGDLTSAASTLHGVAEMHRLAGRLDVAETGYRRAITHLSRTGSEVLIPRLNLGLCLLQRENWRGAHEALLPVYETWVEQGRRGFVAAAALALVPCAMGLGDWEPASEHLAQSRSLLEETGMVDVDLARCAHLAGDLALEAAQLELATRAYALARRQWAALDVSERVAHCDDALLRLASS